MGIIRGKLRNVELSTDGATWQTMTAPRTVYPSTVQQIAAVRRHYPGLPRQVAARLLRRARRMGRPPTVPSVVITWCNPSPLTLADLKQTWEKLRTVRQFFVFSAYEIPARLLQSDGSQNAPAERSLLGYPMRLRGDS